MHHFTTTSLLAEAASLKDLSGCPRGFMSCANTLGSPFFLCKKASFSSESTHSTKMVSPPPRACTALPPLTRGAITPDISSPSSCRPTVSAANHLSPPPPPSRGPTGCWTTGPTGAAAPLSSWATLAASFNEFIWFSPHLGRAYTSPAPTPAGSPRSDGFSFRVRISGFEMLRSSA